MTNPVTIAVAMLAFWGLLFGTPALWWWLNAE